MLFKDEFEKGLKGYLDRIISKSLTEIVLLEGPQKLEPLKVVHGECLDDHLLLNGNLIVSSDNASKPLLLFLQGYF